jgi:S1-C subfamily serine protease
LKAFIPAIGFLGLAAAVPFVHDRILTKRLRERVAEESQLLTLRRQLDDARAALSELEEKGDTSAEEWKRVSRVEETLSSIATQINGFDSRVASSVRALDALEEKASTLERKNRENARETTKVVEAVRTDLGSRIHDAEGRLESTLKRIEAATREDRDLNTMRRELLAPIAQITGEDTVGSGVLLYSDNDADGKHANILVSSYHVVRNILAESPTARDKGVKVVLYPDGTPVEETADMLAHDEGSDLVLLRLRGTRKYADVAKIFPADQCDRLTVFTPIYAVGCPLGNDPVPTSGEISSLRNRISNHDYWMINAPTYFGNSGGGVFHGKTRELIGVFSKIYTHGSGRPTVIPHMGLATPIPVVAEFLNKTGYGFVLPHGTAAADAASASRPATK